MSGAQDETEESSLTDSLISYQREPTDGFDDGQCDHNHLWIQSSISIPSLGKEDEVILGSGLKAFGVRLFTACTIVSLLQA